MNEGNYDYGYGMPEPQKPQSDGLAIASMVLGIVAILMTCCSGYFSIPFAIVGLVLGIMSNRNNGKSGMATAGIVCSIIAIALSIVLIIISIMYFEYAFGIMREMMRTM